MIAVSLLHDFDHPISEIVGELLVKQAYENPNALKNETFSREASTSLSP
jgi:hypothetical protein